MRFAPRPVTYAERRAAAWRGAEAQSERHTLRQDVAVSRPGLVETFSFRAGELVAYRRKEGGA